MDKQIHEMNEHYTRKKRLQRIIALLCVFIILFTVNHLKMVAHTLSRVPTCGFQEHEHEAGCYDDAGNLICGMVEHQHTDACYQEAPTLEIEDNPVIDMPVDDGDALSLDLNSDLVVEDVPAPAANAPVETPAYTLGAKALLSDIINSTDLKIKLETIKKVGIVDADGSQEGLVEIREEDNGDYTIKALRDFAQVEMAIVLADEAVVVKLVDGRADAEQAASTVEDEQAEEPSVVDRPEQPAPAAEDGQDELTVPTVENEQTEQVEQTVVDEQADQTEQPVVEDGQAEEPTVEDAQTEQPVVEDGQVEEPAEDEQTPPERTEEPTVEDTQTEQPAADEQVEAPAVDEGTVTGQTEVSTTEEEPAIKQTEVDTNTGEGTETEKADSGQEAEEVQVDDTAPADQEADAGEDEPADDETARVEGELPITIDTEGEEDKQAEGGQDEVVYTAGSRIIQVNDGSVTLTWPAEAHIPADVVITIAEIEKGTEDYDILYHQALAELPEPEQAVTQVMRFFDITLFTADGEKIEPDAPVSVQVTVNEIVDSDVAALHCEEVGAPMETVDANAEGESVAFDAPSFSVYGVNYSKPAEEETISSQVQVDLSRVDTMGAATIEGMSVSLSVSDLLQGTDDAVSSSVDSKIDTEQFVADAKVSSSDVTVENGTITLPADALDKATVSLQVETKETNSDYITTVVTHTVDIMLSDYAGRTEETAGEGVTVKAVGENSLPADAKASVEENVAVPVSVEVAEGESAAAFDINLTNGNGDAISGPVAVTVMPSELNVLAELPEGAVAKRIEYTLIHIHDDGTSETVDLPADAVVVDENGKVESFSFQTESFSTYVLIYTVDFEYNDPETGETFMWSFPGQGSYSIAAIMAELGVTGQISDVSLVRTVDAGGSPKALYLSEDKTALVSEEAFLDTFELTVVVDGKKYVLEVTDDYVPNPTSTNLADFLVSATISAPTDQNGAYVLNPGDKYAINLTFKEEDDGLQFDDNGPLTYRMPDNLLADGESGSLTIKVKEGTQTYSVPGNTYVIQRDAEGHDYLVFNWSTDTSISHVKAASNTAIVLTFEGGIRENTEKIIFTDGLEKDIHIDTSNSVSVSKTADVRKNEDKLIYTVTVVSTGKSENVVLTDTLTGEGLTLDGTSFSARSSRTNAPVAGATLTVDPESVNNKNQFKYELGNMENGEVITIQYAADIDPKVLKKLNGKTVTTANNGVKVVSKGDPVGDNKTITNTIDYTPSINKSGATITDGNNGKKILDWTITYNSEVKVPAGGDTITDTISANSQSIMKYCGDGIKVTVYNANGEIERAETTIQWGDLAQKTDSVWKYVIPTNDTQPYKYVITYQTEVDPSGLNEITTVKNDVTTDGGNSGSGGGQVGPVGPDILLDKQFESIDHVNKEMTWKVTFTVPTEGLNQAVVEDQYPKSYQMWTTIRDEYKGWIFYDIVKQGSVEVAGLLSGETWDIKYGETAATITFYKDDQPGLKPNTQSRLIEVTLKTVLDENWLELSKLKDWEYTRAHTNTVNLTYDGKVKTDSDTVTVTAPMLKKTATPVGVRKVNGVELPIYQYRVELFGVENDVNEIVDTFNTELLEVYNGAANNFWVYHGNNMESVNYARMNSTDTSWTTGVPATYNNTTTGIIIYTNGESLKKGYRNVQGAYYPIYGVQYYLTVKNETALAKIMGNAARREDGKYDIDNTAEWEGHTGTGKITYEYKGLEKKLLTPESALTQQDDDIWMDFRITLNPSGATLNNGEPLMMRDTVENLSVDITSIRAKVGSIQSVEMQGNTVTYVIPDSTKVVIEYRAKAVFADIGATNTTTHIQFRNTAEVLGYHDDVSGDAYRRNSGSGTASVPQLNIIKYAAGNIQSRLQGAVFELLDQNKQPIVDKENKAVTFTTDAQGKAVIEGGMAEHGWNLTANKLYYIHETVAPAGYTLDNTYYQFKISENSETDYGQYLYYSGDNLTVKNYPGTYVTVNKVWSDGNEKHGADTVTIKLQQRMKTSSADDATWGPWSDNIRKKVKQSNGEYVWQDVELTIELNANNKWKDSFTDLESKVPLNLPALKDTPDVDAEYQIVETQVNGKSLTEAGVTAHKIEQNASTNGYSYTVTNTVEANTGDLELLKKVTGKEDTTTQFEFEITLTAPAGVTLKSSYAGTQGGTQKTFTVAEGKISGIKLRHGEKAVINGLPAGTQYKVEEKNIPKGFNPTWINQNGIIPNSSGAKVSVSAENVFTAEANTTFSVKKNFIGGNLNDMQFTFKLTQVDADNSTTPVTTKLANPVTVTTDRAAGTEQTMSFALPEDFKFTQDDIGKTFWFMIEEEVPEEARTSPFIAEGVKYANPCQQWVSVTISESAGALVVTKSTTEEQPDAEFTNEQLGKLIVTKTYAGNAADNLTDQQKQAITFSIDGPNGFDDIAERPLSDESFKKGADGAYTLTLNNIPLG